MKEKRGGLVSKVGRIFISLLILSSLLLNGCTNNTLKVNTLKVDSVDTASSVTLIKEQRDWRTYVQQKSFASGYKGEFWVMFSFSSMLHDKTIWVKAHIYIVSNNGELKGEKNKEATITDSSDNRLWWGDSFDVSSYPDGDYSAIVTITDLIAGTSASRTNTFKIGASP